MLNRQHQMKPKQWCRGDYAPSIIIRFLLMLALWVFYGMIPHKLSSNWLLIVSAVMITYCYQLHRRKAVLMLPLMIIAAVLNTCLIVLLPMDAQSIYPLTLPPILIIYFVLLIDIVRLPQTLD